MKSSPTSPETPPGAEPRLVAAREDGIYELTFDGRDVRKLSAAHATALGWQELGKRVVFLVRETGELRSLDVATAKEQLIARLRTELRCPSDDAAAAAQDYAVELDVQDGSDLVVLPARACVRLMDRNANMASYILDAHVDLKSGKVTDYLSFAPDECKLPRSEAVDECYEDPAAKAASVRAPTSSDFELPPGYAGPPGFEVLSWSPSKRWVVVYGNREEGDYIHFQVALYEVATKRSFPVVGELVESGGDWPAPLPAAQLKLGYEDRYSTLGDVVGETPIYWLEGNADRLVVGENLVLPGKRIIRVGKVAN